MLANTLASTGNPLPNKEFVTYLLNGLSPSFESFITSITTRAKPITFHELYHLLLIHENRLSHTFRNTSSPTFFTPLANLSTGQTHNQRGRGSHRGTYLIVAETEVPSKDDFHPHSLFKITTPNKILIALPVTSPSANYTFPSAIIDSSWYPDSAVTHHITHYLSQLNISSEPYRENEQIRVGNGNGLLIDIIGESSLNSNLSSFRLHNLLHVPTITKNLVYVSQFCTNNDCFFEFHSDHFSVKSKSTGKLLICGPTCDGLY
ncbi:hypothetical protein F2P56_000181 [Juglans regia]|uniref:Retrovirus-related Pol polyprotein from transposon TNT 1-94-like beta-barrel domain-containing protein n=1 Tax=Juglans regia TaxID=51240 RepID=A0A834D2W0_JUGRE|nr:hypothetical protein F2P56_000181 [Juglans regia]